MKSKKFDRTEVRKILAAMATNRVVCGRIATQWPIEGLFETRWANLVGGWCVDHLRKFDAPIRAHIRDVFEEWASSTAVDDELVTAVERFLVAVSDEDAQVDVDYILDLSARHFNGVRFKRELEMSLLEIERGSLEQAQARVSNLYQVELGLGSYVEPGADLEAWHQAFDTERRATLVTYPGDLGSFLGDSFCKGEFYAFMAPDKTGKSTFLIDFAYRAARQRNRVVFFDSGDSDQDEVMVRLASRSTRCPEYAQECNIPVDWDDEGLIVKKKELKAVDPIEAYNQFRKVIKDPQAFKLSCHSNSSLSVQGIDSILRDWERDDWIPDIVVIDYADILAPPAGIKDTNEQIDETWKQLRRLSQQRHCLVVTATQSNAAAYSKGPGLLGPQNFSGRKTKLAHVNGMLGINVTPEERSQHSARINWVVRRRMRQRERRKYVRIAGCFDIENPVIKSIW